MLGRVRKAWQGALQGMVSQGRLQQEADVFRIYLCVKYFESNGDGAADLLQDIPPYEVQKDVITQSLNTQLRLMLSRVDDYVRSPGSLSAKLDMPFSLRRAASTIPGAGEGAFLDGYAKPGSLVALYPGAVYTPLTAHHMPNFPHIDKDNSYLMVRWDNCVIDGKGYDTGLRPPRSQLAEIQGDDSAAEDLAPNRNTLTDHPYAYAHVVNHPPAGAAPNVASFSFDYPLSLPDSLHPYVPNKYQKPPGLLYGGDCLVRGLVFVATSHITNEELFLNYRYNPNRPLPSWYTSVDPEEDARRWAT